MSNPITTETIIRIWPKHTPMGGGTAGKTKAKESNEGLVGRRHSREHLHLEVTPL